MAWGLDLVAYFLCPLTMMVEIYSALKMGKIFNKGAFKYYVSIFLGFFDKKFLILLPQICIYLFHILEHPRVTLLVK